MQLAEELANRGENNSLLSVESPMSAGKDKNEALVSADWSKSTLWSLSSLCCLVQNIYMECPLYLLISPE